MKPKEEMSVIYGKNTFFNKAIFYGCKGDHIEKVKGFLERAEKYYAHSRSSILLSLAVYPLLLFFFRKYFNLLTILISVDFGSGLFFFPFGSPALTEKFGIRSTIYFLRIAAASILIAAAALVARYLI